MAHWVIVGLLIALLAAAGVDAAIIFVSTFIVLLVFAEVQGWIRRFLFLVLLVLVNLGLPLVLAGVLGWSPFIGVVLMYTLLGAMAWTKVEHGSAAESGKGVDADW